MNKELGFPSLREFMEGIIATTRRVVNRDARSSEPKQPDIDSMSPATTVMAIIREELHGTMPNASENAIEASVTDAISSILEDLEMEGINLRHPDVWFLHPVDVVHAQIAAMRYRNAVIRGHIGEAELLAALKDFSGEELSADDIESPAKTSSTIAEVYYLDEGSATPLADALLDVLDDYYLDLSEQERLTLERKRSMSGVYSLLTEKLNARNTNDGMVQYGVLWSRSARESTLEQWDMWGGINGAALGLAVKHRPDLFEVLLDKRAMGIYGLTARIPESERTGGLAQSQAPVRVYLRTDRSLSMNDFASPFAYMKAELGLYEQDPSAPHFDYADIHAMMDDGWVLD